METSSDESFTWGKVSNVSEDSTGSSADDKNKNEVKKGELDIKDMNGNTSAIVSSETKPKKRKIKNESASSEDSSCSPRKKKIKLEPNSDIDVKKKKRKKECFDESYESTEQQQKDDKSFLNLKVKEELESVEKHKLKKKRKKNHTDGNDTVNSNNELDVEIIVKSKSKKKNKHADIENVSFSLNDPVVEKSPRKKKHKLTTVNDDNDETGKETATEEENVSQSIVSNDDSKGNQDEDNTVENSVQYMSDESSKFSEKKYLHNSTENINKVTKNDDLNSSTVPKNKHSNSRILDRIRFEDDVDSNIELSQSNNKQNDDDSFLNLKVKEELESVEKQKLKKKRKKCHTDSNDTVNSNNELDAEIIVENKTKKKKKHADIENVSFSLNDPVVEKSPRKKKHKLTTVNDDNDETGKETATEEENVSQSIVSNDDSKGNQDEDNTVENSVQYMSDESSKFSEKKYLHNSTENINKVTKNDDLNSSTVPKNKHSNSRILDRIRFEDDVDSNIELSQSNNKQNDDDSFLNLKVKEELESVEKQKLKKKRKKCHTDSNDTVNSNNELDAEIIVENKTKKKKKHADIENVSFSLNDPVVEKSPRKKKHKITTENGDIDETGKETATEEENVSQSIVSNDDSKGNQDEDNTVENSVQYMSDESSKFSEKKYLHNSTENINKVTKNDDLNSSTVPKNKHSNSRILDRITFEDDVDSNIELSQSKDGYSLKLKKYLRSSSVLQPITNDIQYCSEVTQDDEIWIIKCPHEIEVNSFSNKDFALDAKCKIKMNGETYCGILDDQIGSVTIMSKEKNKSTIKNVKISGVISFRKRLRKPHYMEDNMIQNHNEFIPLPETKPRHPLFGSNYQNAIKVPSSLLQRLREDIPTTVNYDKKKKKKSNKDRNIDVNVEFMELKKPKVEVAEDSPVRKAKKRKHHKDEEVPIKKAKRIKKEIDSSEVWDSEKAIEENLFNF